MLEYDALRQMLIDAKNSLESGNPDEIQWALDIPIPLIREEVAANGPSGVKARAAIFGEFGDLLNLYISVMQLAAEAEGRS